MARSISFSATGFILLALFSLGNSYPHYPDSHSHSRFHNKAARSYELSESTCRPVTSPFNYSAKIRSEHELPVCLVEENTQAAVELSTLFARQDVDDYSCGPDKPCKNGACCPKETLFCNYGEAACGTNGQSPNDVCWSNCDAHSECGENSDPPGKKCPLNVCCSKHGFCGTTTDFCDKAQGCQSGCGQPSSTGSDGDIQKRVIGYYEAWAHDRKCQGMDFAKIPVGALTHLIFSFAYITPGEFSIAPMDDLDPKLFSQFTAVKKKNSGLKALIAIGGWTFNDPGPTQKIFGDMVSTKANRQKFIENLFSFMREFAFDGVDFDWEYPSADDRGGSPEDGAKFVTFLKELNDYNKKQMVHYTVSFTVPTSYWYLRHFDLKAIDHVDWVNVMSYDLHGVWDRNSTIGNNVLAHTNLTEIQIAFDLFWRNDVKASKLNIGFGFYGRSFQLSDPSCYKPGCKFKGGATKGGCSGESGILSYREIQNIIKSNDLDPYYLKKEAVKYITWNKDQWVSYDDKETFQQKIKWANSVGLGGMLIWAIDQDTDDLEALSGLLYPNSLKEFQKIGDNKAYWENATVPNCYVSGCGSHCKAGFLKVTTQPCGAPNWHGGASEDDSELCCPIQGSPNPSDCTWRGGGRTPQSCNGHCHDDEVTMQMNRWGDHSGYCFDGNKAYCCKSPLATENKCYWAGVNQKCNGDDVAMTFSGTFLSSIVDVLNIIVKVIGRRVPLVALIGEPLVSVLDAADMELNKYYCCPKEDAANWQSCGWYGDVESSDTCFDNHCPINGHSVQLTDSPYGLGESCFPRMERARVFCCDPAGGQAAFLPVPLENLFKEPPTGDNVDTDYDLNIDDTWGTGVSKTHDDDDNPSDAAFSFVVLTSPEELQVSLDKRDGSNWDLLNCHELDKVSEEEQTVQIVCTDVSETSNCHKIGLGHGVPGTILQMPEGCGAGKYAVAKSMTLAKFQDRRLLPRRLQSLEHEPIVYDLAFDNDFSRVPRSESGDTQMRIDFSNQENYWDEVVAAAVSKRTTKRSLEHDAGGNHRRWLEDEFRQDLQDADSNLLRREELHRRWFGQGVLEWLSKMLSPSISREFRHEFQDEFTAKIVEEQWHCGKGDTTYDGYILAQATTSIDVATSFGFTLTARIINGKINLDGSFLTFYNEGHIKAILKVEASASVRYKKESNIVILPIPGAALRVPGIVTIGPSIRVDGKIDVGVKISAEIETTIDIATWEFRQTLPDPGGDKDPKTLDQPDYSKSGSWEGIQKPQVYAGVLAEGDATVHLIAAVDFGITFDQKWGLGAAAASVVADGWVMLQVAAGVSTEATCPFTYGVTVGADMSAVVQAPTAFGWSGRTWSLPSPPNKELIKAKTCPDLRGGDPTKRKRSNIGSSVDPFGITDNSSAVIPQSHLISKRSSGPWGPAFRIPIQDLFCPDSGSGPSSGKECKDIRGWDDNEWGVLSKRNIDTLEIRELSRHVLEKRSKNKPDPIGFCNKGRKGNPASLAKNAPMVYQGPAYDTSSTLLNVCPGCLIYGYTSPIKDCNDYGFGQVAQPMPDTGEYQTEHILEMQLLGQFFDEMNAGSPSFVNPLATSDGKPVSMCKAVKPYWYQLKLGRRVLPPGAAVPADPISFIAQVWPGSDNNEINEFVLLEHGINNCKGAMWGASAIRTDDKMTDYNQKDPEKAVRNIKDCLMALRYLQDPIINQRLLDQKNRVSAKLAELDTQVIPAQLNPRPAGDKFKPYPTNGLDLSGKWNIWIHNKARASHIKVKNHIAEGLRLLVENYATPVHRQNAGNGNAGNGNAASDLAAAFILKIDTLQQQYTLYGQNEWIPPF